MEYRSQLVVRTRDAEGARVIARVKEFADERGTSISDAALLLLDRALAGKSVPAASAASANGGGNGASERAAEVESLWDDDDEPLPTTTNLNDAPQNVAVKTVETLESKGNDAAARCLAEFFESASAVDGGRVRAELTHRLKPAQYEELHAALRETDEYRRYTRRLVGR